MSHSCLDCVPRSDGVFCDLESDALAAFDGIKSARTCPKGAVLFREGQTARSVFLLCTGRVRLSLCSESGRRMTVRVAGPGEALGLSAAVSGGRYEVTAEALEGLQVAAVRRKDLLRFLHEHCDVCLQVVNLLSEDLHVAYNRVRAVGLGRTRRARATRVH
ncbi:MAG TPA: cyclic nucleotide-binding domain-containing protein [Terriglobales bacterium]|nr:cyclic nucleotide-binding domain-containing protein [Terriglobales bacterium]